MFAPTSSKTLSGNGTGAHDYVPEQDKHLPKKESMPTEKDETAADVDGSAARDHGTHTATIESRQGSARPTKKSSSLTPEERRQVEENADVARNHDGEEHPHLLHGTQYTSEPKSLNQLGARGARELEGNEGHHTVEGGELRGNGIHGHGDEEQQDMKRPGPGEGMSAASRPPVTQRVKGRVEVLLGKAKNDTEMMDRGLRRQRQVEPSAAGAGANVGNAQATSKTGTVQA